MDEMNLTQYWANVNKMGPLGCWIWIGAKAGTGYGSVRFNGRSQSAHRVAWETTRTLIPAGMQIDHLCRNRSCVNPQHLEVVTQAENMRRGVSPTAINARKTQCPRGHPYDRTSPRGDRECTTCRDQRNKDRSQTNIATCAHCEASLTGKIISARYCDRNCAQRARRAQMS